MYLNRHPYICTAKNILETTKLTIVVAYYPPLLATITHGIFVSNHYFKKTILKHNHEKQSWTKNPKTRIWKQNHKNKLLKNKKIRKETSPERKILKNKKSEKKYPERFPMGFSPLVPERPRLSRLRLRSVHGGACLLLAGGCSVESCEAGDRRWRRWVKGIWV